MTDRAETIMDAIKTAVTGLGTTTNKVVRGRAWAAQDTPALSVDMGSESPGDYNVAFQDEVLTVEIAAQVKGAEGTTDTTLNQIRAEVYAAVMAAPQLGLPFVINTVWRGRSRPLHDEGEKDLVEQVFRFDVHYRHSVTSTES